MIVCEGEKTEPFYFEGARKHYGLSSANIEIVQAGGDPLSIARRAIQKLNDDRELDRAYCVFDRDTHTTFDEALRLISEHRLSANRRLFAAYSIPCFEIWLLLHFAYSTAPYSPGGGRSAAANVLHALQQRWPEYNKGRTDAFEALATRMDKAFENARKLMRHNASAVSANPATTIHELVEYLKNLKK